MLKFLRAVTTLFVALSLSLAASAQPSGSSFGAVPVGPVKKFTSASSATTMMTYDVGGYTEVSWSYTSIGSGNQVASEVSFDNGTTWLLWPSYKPNAITASTSTAWTIDTTSGYTTVVPAGTRFRLRVAVYGSGTITAYVTFQPANDPLFQMTNPGSSGSTTAVGGNVASGATDSGNPVKVGGVHNTTRPTLTNGQRGDLQLGTRGGLNVNIYGADNVNGAQVASSTSDGDAAQFTLYTIARGQNFNGSTHDRDFTCPSSAVINVAAAATTQLVALQSSQIIRVCSFVITGDTAATTATFVYGTGANCGTGQVALTGAMRMVDEGSISSTGMNGSLFRSAASNALCLTAATGAVTGFVTYAQY